jgi:hypothetical protein
MNSTTTANNIDWGTVAAWIALAVAIISPIITSIINNIHLSKMERLKIINNRGLDVIEEYITITSREILTLGISENYEKCYAKIFIYAPDSLHKTLHELNDLICSCGNNSFPNKIECQKLLIKISKSLKYNKF